MADERTENVVEEIRVDAAVVAGHAAADDVAGAAVAAAGAVAAEVAVVGTVLEEHAEASEERHEEILGDTEWIRNRLEQLSMILQSLLTTVTAMQAAITAEFQALRTVSESTAMQQSTPVEAEVIAVVEPPAVAEDQRVVETPPQENRKRRRVI